MHPTVIIGAYRQALEDLLEVLHDKVSIPVDVSNREEMKKIIKSCIGTKFLKKWFVFELIVSLNPDEVINFKSLKFGCLQ